MKPPKLDRCFVFDMDGVLVDNNRFHKRAYAAFFKRHGLGRLDEETFRSKMSGRSNEDILPGLMGRKLSAAECRRLAAEKETLYRKIYAPHARPLPGLRRFLERLKREGAKVALATSAPRPNVGFTLRATGLSRYFKVRVDSSEVKEGKPHPDLYLKAAKKLGVDPRRCVAFEDSKPGIRSARAAGMKVIGVATTHQDGELRRAGAVRVIRDFRGI